MCIRDRCKYYDTPYFVSSQALKQTEYCTIELKKVYRQNDGTFLELLNRIRENRCDGDVYKRQTERYAGYSDSFDYCRTAGNGIHGLFGGCEDLKKKKRK